MDRPELREKIDNILLRVAGYKPNDVKGWFEHPDGYTRKSRPSFSDDLDQILTLIPNVDKIFEEMEKHNVIAIKKGKSLNELGLLLTMEYWLSLKDKFKAKRR